MQCFKFVNWWFWFFWCHEQVSYLDVHFHASLGAGKCVQCVIKVWFSLSIQVFLEEILNWNKFSWTLQVKPNVIFAWLRVRYPINVQVLIIVYSLQELFPQCVWWQFLFFWFTYNNLFTTWDPPKYSNSNSPNLCFCLLKGDKKYFGGSDVANKLLYSNH